MELTEGTDARVMDIVVDKVRADPQIEGGVRTMAKCNDGPYLLEAASGGRLVFGSVVLLARSFHACQSTLGLLSSYQFDQVCNEQLAWNGEVESKAIDDVLAAVVVARKTYENAILGKSVSRYQTGMIWPYLAEVLNHQSQVRKDWLRLGAAQHGRR